VLDQDYGDALLVERDQQRQDIVDLLCESPAIASSAISSLGAAAIARASSSLRISIWVKSRGPPVRLRGKADLLQQLGDAVLDAVMREMHAAASRIDGIEQRHVDVLGDAPWCERASAAGSCVPDRAGCADAPPWPLSRLLSN